MSGQERLVGRNDMFSSFDRAEDHIFGAGDASNELNDAVYGGVVQNIVIISDERSLLRQHKVTRPAEDKSVNRKEEEGEEGERVRESVVLGDVAYANLGNFNVNAQSTKPRRVALQQLADASSDYASSKYPNTKHAVVSGEDIKSKNE